LDERIQSVERLVHTKVADKVEGDSVGAVTIAVVTTKAIVQDVHTSVALDILHTASHLHGAESIGDAGDVFGEGLAVLGARAGLVVEAGALDLDGVIVVGEDAHGVVLAVETDGLLGLSAVLSIVGLFEAFVARKFAIIHHERGVRSVVGVGGGIGALGADGVSFGGGLLHDIFTGFADGDLLANGLVFYGRESVTFKAGGALGVGIGVHSVLGGRSEHRITRVIGIDEAALVDVYGVGVVEKVATNVAARATRVEVEHAGALDTTEGVLATDSVLVLVEAKTTGSFDGTSVAREGLDLGGEHELVLEVTANIAARFTSVDVVATRLVVFHASQFVGALDEGASLSKLEAASNIESTVVAGESFDYSSHIPGVGAGDLTAANLGHVTGVNNDDLVLNWVLLERGNLAFRNRADRGPLSGLPGVAFEDATANLFLVGAVHDDSAVLDGVSLEHSDHALSVAGRVTRVLGLVPRITTGTATKNLFARLAGFA